MSDETQCNVADDHSVFCATIIHVHGKKNDPALVSKLFYDHHCPIQFSTFLSHIRSSHLS